MVEVKGLERCLLVRRIAGQKEPQLLQTPIGSTSN